MKTTRRLNTYRILGLACIGALTACSQSATSTPTPDSTSVPEGVIVVTSPLSELATQYEQVEKDSYDAVQKATTACMKERGFEYIPLPREEAITVKYPSQTFGDIEKAKTDGFGISSNASKIIASASTIPTDQTATLPDEKRAAYFEALYGPDPIQQGDDGQNTDESNKEFIVTKSNDSPPTKVSRKACQIVGQATISPDIDKKLQSSATLSDILREIHNSTEADQRYQDANKKWTQCMTEAGFEEKSRKQYIEDLNTKAMSSSYEGTAQLDTVKEEEIKIATAAATCDRSSQLGQVLKEVQDETEKKALESRKDFVGSFTELNNQTLQRANDYMKEK